MHNALPGAVITQAMLQINIVLGHRNVLSCRQMSLEIIARELQFINGLIEFPQPVPLRAHCGHLNRRLVV